MDFSQELLRRRRGIAPCGPATCGLRRPVPPAIDVLRAPAASSTKARRVLAARHFAKSRRKFG
jgi:hypothetical protein